MLLAWQVLHPWNQQPLSRKPHLWKVSSHLETIWNFGNKLEFGKLFPALETLLRANNTATSTLNHTSDADRSLQGFQNKLFFITPLIQNILFPFPVLPGATSIVRSVYIAALCQISIIILTTAGASR